ncbi:MAG: winged helix-turn-helix transcriptional regulator [Candidatus Methanofastidiosa archaeon]|nr:winged helix-turn-helix transcriptional regulator [Candidatus Methanofastidiosa archaeon]
MDKDIKIEEELKEIKSELSLIRKELRNLSRAPLDQNNANARDNFRGVISSLILEDLDQSLDNNLVSDCNKNPLCKNAFRKILLDNQEQIDSGKFNEENSSKNKDKLDDMKKTAPYGKCEICFGEVSELFGKQVRIARSMKIYKSKTESMSKLNEISVDALVSDFLEPVANIHRLQIVKSLANGTKSFSELSKITGLTGGNLLFHLQKLTENEIILQSHERGDYLITEKGHAILLAVLELHLSMNLSKEEK